MTRYFLKRVLMTLPTLLGISVVCFFLVQLTPGGPVEQTLAEYQRASVGEGGGARVSAVTEEQRQALVEYYGFDKPIVMRYFRWLSKLVRLDFGDSYYYSEPVSHVLARALPVSLAFGFVSFFLSYLVCIPLGILKAVKHGSRFDIATSGIVFFLYSIPSFALGVLLIVLLGGGSFWNVFPIEGLYSDGFADLSLFAKAADLLYHMTLPLVCYTIGSFATLTLIVKSSLLEQLRQDYVVTARAKGLSERKIVLRHALKNALIPVANGLGQWIALFFSGTLLIETVFGLEGIGRLSYESIVRRDYPVVLAVILCLSVLHIAGNLLSDALYAVIDPRIDFA